MPGAHKGSQQQGPEELRFAGIADPGGIAKGKGSAGVTLSSFTLALFQSRVIFIFSSFQVGATSVLKNR